MKRSNLSRITLLVTVLALSACVAIPPEKPFYQAGISQYQMSHDKLLCDQIQYQELVNRGLDRNPFYTSSTSNDCMKGLGYSQ
jgi:hypothetical protein